jgi:hypothetical protein
MLERTSEQLLVALASLEGLNVKPRDLMLDAKAQGLVLVSLVNSLIEMPESEPMPSSDLLDSVRETIEDYVRMVRLLQENSNQNQVA